MSIGSSQGQDGCLGSQLKTEAPAEVAFAHAGLRTYFEAVVKTRRPAERAVAGQLSSKQPRIQASNPTFFTFKVRLEV